MIQELRDLIRTTLTPLGLYSPAAEELLVATCAQESALGKFRRQVGGPALGIFQMEPDTFNDIQLNYLRYHHALALQVCALGNDGMDHMPFADELVTNDELAIAMARIQYLRAPDPLPAATDLAGLWKIYKKVYNTPKGAATMDQFYGNYRTLVAGSAT